MTRGNPKGTNHGGGPKGQRKTYHIQPNGDVWAETKKKCTRVNGWIDNKGYRNFTINSKCAMGHRLVAQKYIPNPDNLEQVDHINRCRHDNRVENLRWVTRQTNCDNRVFGGTIEQAILFLQGHGYTITKT